MKKLLSKTGLDKAYQTVNSVVLVGTVSDDLNVHAAHDTKGKNTKERLCVNSSLFLLNPDGALELIGLLNKECSRTRMQTYLILNCYFINIHCENLLAEIM